MSSIFYSGNGGLYLLRSSALAGSATNPVPAVTSLSPSSATAGGAAFILTVSGTSFVNGSTVNWNGIVLTTNYVSATQLTATVPASDIANPTNASVTVTNSAPGGDISSALAFTVNAVNPAPIISGITPNSTTAGGAAFTLTVNGASFVKGSTMNWNGTALTTSYVSATQLTATVPANDIVNAGNASVTVTNPAPGGGTSSAAAFTVSAATPGATLSVASLSFGNVAVGATSTSQSLTLANPGTAPLAITSIAASNGFSETNSCGSSLAVGATCTIAVTFSPAWTGATTGSLTVTDNAAGSPQTVSLSGTGAEPVIIAPSSGGSTSATVSSGGTAVYNLTLNGSSGFSGGVSLSCSGAPSNATCQVSPSSLTLSSGGNAVFKVTVNTGSGSTAMLSGSSTIKLASCGLAALLLLPLFTQRRRLVRSGAFIIAIGCVFLSLSGCGGGSSPTTANSGSPVTSAGTYTLTVTATAGNATVAQSLTLAVQ